MATEQPLPADERIYTDENFGMELFWEKNKTVILLGLAALLVLVLAVGVWAYRQSVIKQESQEAFALADSLESWRKIVDEFPNSMPAAASRLMIAESLREGGDLEASTEAYSEFLTKIPQTNPLQGLALLGEAQNASAVGNMTASLEKLKEAAASSSSYTAELALLLQGRQLAEEGKYQEARAIYESITTEFPNSLAARVALSQIQQLSIITPANPAKN